MLPPPPLKLLGGPAPPSSYAYADVAWLDVIGIKTTLRVNGLLQGFSVNIPRMKQLISKDSNKRENCQKSTGGVCDCIEVSVM